MIQLQVRLKFTEEESRVEYDLFEREDANEAERKHAALYEALMRAVMAQWAHKANGELKVIDSVPERRVPEIVITREPVSWFATQMELELRKHDDQRGAVGWRDERIRYLLDRMLEEVDELVALRPYLATAQADEVVSEAADVANLAMMIADNIRGNHDRHGS